MTGREYSILSPASCYTHSCTKPTCGKQYVGKCKPSLSVRHYSHMKEIRDQSSALGKHFGGPGGCGSEAFFIQIIETDVKLDKLRKVEGDWQQELAVIAPLGINIRKEKTKTQLTSRALQALQTGPEMMDISDDEDKALALAFSESKKILS